MNIGKKAALLAAASGALVLGGAGGASAFGLGGAPFFGGGVQVNDCDTTTGVTAGPLSGSSPEFASECINLGSGHTAQVNDCDSNTTVGATITGNEGNFGSRCANISTSGLGYGGGFGH